VSRAARPAGPGRWPAGLAWVLWVLCALGLVAVFWLDYLLRRAGRSELALRAHEVP
jgi:tellurite resistance protein TehA-like permease